jgi:hypothetical protein
MPSQDHKSEIEKLRLELSQKELMLEEFFKSNEVFQKAKEIIIEIDGIKDRIEALKSKNGL